MKQTSTLKTELQRKFPILLIAAGLVGMTASTVLNIEKEHLLKNPDAVLACDINPVYSCGSILQTDQAAILGFSNEVFGIMMFAALITLGVTLLAGGVFRRWLWQLFLIGMTVAVIAMSWFIYQSIYVIGALCVYCTLVWLSTWTITNYGVAWCYDHKLVPLPARLRPVAAWLRRNTIGVWLAVILSIVVLILQRFWYYYGQYF